MNTRLRHNRIHHSRGFTLLEIMLALSLTAMLLAMLTAGVFGVVRDWDNNSNALENALEQSVALLQIERALTGAMPHSYRHEQRLSRHVYFEGEADTLRWVSTVSPQRGSGLTAWRLSNSAEGVVLQLAPALTDSPDLRLQNAEERLLLPGYQARFNYLYEALDFERRWRDDWPGVDFNVLPYGVHVRLDPLESDSRESLDIVAPILAREHRAIRPNLELIR